MIGLSWEWLGKLAALFSSEFSPIAVPANFWLLNGENSCNRLWFMAAFEWGLTHQWSSEQGTLRGKNFCSKIKSLSGDGIHNEESSSVGVCVSCPVEENYQGYKCMLDEWRKDWSLKADVSVLRLVEKNY